MISYPSVYEPVMISASISSSIKVHPVKFGDRHDIDKMTDAKHGCTHTSSDKILNSS